MTTEDRQPYWRSAPRCPECGGPPDTGAGHDCEPSGPTPSERLRLDLHGVVCRVRPDGLHHAFVFDPQGILSDCRFLRDRLTAFGWASVPPDLDVLAEAVYDADAEQNDRLYRWADLDDRERDMARRNVRPVAKRIAALTQADADALRPFPDM